MDAATRACICVPAHDEQDALPNLLQALADQRGVGRVRVIVTLNNCRDGSVDVTEAARRRCFDRIDIVADRVWFPDGLANVGAARGRAMRLGAAWLQEGGAPDSRQVLLTTDADAVPPPDWVACNLAAIDAGADCVGGRLVALPAGPVDDRLARRQERIAAYWEAVRQMEEQLDPVVCDPAPRHGDHTGASIAVRRQVFEEVGGMPELRSGEDTEFVRRVVAAGYRLRHAPAVWVAVSAREVGRAPGGMADYLSSLRESVARGTDLLMPGAGQWRDRIMWRAGIRAAGGDAAVAQAETGLPPMRDDCPIEQAIQELHEACLMPCG